MLAQAPGNAVNGHIGRARRARLWVDNIRRIPVADAGNEFICPLNALKKRQSATDDELDNCVDDAITGRCAANLEIVE